ncbi:hypothetical protein ACKKBF_B40925 [Auxenochlorella protothecoides x Auxenochlorella symbiontica]
MARPEVGGRSRPTMGYRPAACGTGRNEGTKSYRATGIPCQQGHLQPALSSMPGLIIWPWTLTRTARTSPRSAAELDASPTSLMNPRRWSSEASWPLIPSTMAMVEGEMKFWAQNPRSLPFWRGMGGRVGQ